jgi:hypothetical protein
VPTALLPFGKAAAEALRTVGTAVRVVKEVTDSFSARGREISGYNGRLAASVAVQDVTRVMTDIRESMLLGDKYAKLIEAQTRFEETLKAGLLPLKEWVLEKLPVVLNMILDVLIRGLDMLSKLPGMPDMMEEMADEMKKMRETLAGHGPMGDLLHHWLFPPAIGFAAPPGPAGGPLAIPLFPAAPAP